MCLHDLFGSYQVYEWSCYIGAMLDSGFGHCSGGLTQVYEVRCNSFIFLNTHSKHSCTQFAIYLHYAATETKGLPECKLVAYSFIFDHYFK